MRPWRPRLLLVLALLLAAGCRPAPETDDRRLTARGLLGPDDAAGFARATEPRRFAFPRDHGPHPDFRTEWWYLTGNLRDASDNRYGFQLTFFRFALVPTLETRGSPWRTRNVWMVHLAVTDVKGGRHHAAERFARGAAGLAGAQAEPFAVWLDDWQVAADGSRPGRWQLTAATDDLALALTLEPRKPPVLQGDAGLSQKSAETGNASYYYSLTRIAASGEVTVGGRRAAVSGSAWLDREWSTSALGREQAGWDWFALQFHDGHEFMFYRLRTHSGATDPHSAGTLIAPSGGVRVLGANDVTLEPLRHWRADDGRRYPVAWRLAHEPSGRHWELRPVLDDQEMALSVRYWEGAVDVLEPDGTPVGVGYVELAGYD